MDSLSALSVERYLARILCPLDVPPDAEFLAELQTRHLHAVPYENLDILAGRRVSLELNALYTKVVEQGRGGYCFELNALFAWLLRALGYGVVDYVARFWREERSLPPKRRHHVLGVWAEGRQYLVDVGVGGVVPVRPLLLEHGIENVQGTECYRLMRDPRFGWILQERKRESWSWVYSFTEEPQESGDFAFADFWCQNAEASPFRQNAMAAIRTKEGRHSIAGNEVRLFRGNAVEILTPSDPTAWKEALLQHFGIRIGADFPYAILGRR